MKDIRCVTHMDNVRLSDDGTAVVIVDQTQLPNRTVYLTLRTPEEMYDAIFELKVRGAPAIGICAAYAAYCLAQQIPEKAFLPFRERFAAHCAYLNGSRPTAVNLSWALSRMLAVVDAHAGQPIPEILALLHAECLSIHREDIDMCMRISENGLSLLHDRGWCVDALQRRTARHLSVWHRTGTVFPCKGAGDEHPCVCG